MFYLKSSCYLFQVIYTTGETFEMLALFIYLLADHVWALP